MCMLMCICISIDVYIYIYVYGYIFIHTYTYIYMYIYLLEYVWAHMDIKVNIFRNLCFVWFALCFHDLRHACV